MRRRKLLIGIGAAAAGGSAAFGTEAFTSVQAERNVDVAVAGDRSSFVAIQPLSSSNASTYVDTESDNTVELELDGDLGNGEGVTQDAITQLEDLFRVVNQGSQEVSVYFEDDSDAVTFRVTRSTSTSTTGSNGQSLEGPDNSAELDVGEQVVVGMTVDTLNNDVSGQLLDSAVLYADANASAPQQSIPEPQYIVDGEGSDDNTFGTLSQAVNAAESGAVVGIEGGYTESPDSFVTVDTSDVTITGLDGSPPVIDDANGGGIEVSADGITLRNFEVKGVDDRSQLSQVITVTGTPDNLTVDGVAARAGREIGGPVLSLDKYNASSGVGDNLTVTNCEIEDNSIGISLTGSSVNSAEITNNTINPGGDGIFVTDTSGTNLTIEGNGIVDIDDDEGSLIDSGKFGIKLTESAASVNGETGTEDQLESLLTENTVSEVSINSEIGTSAGGSRFSDIQSAISAASRLTIVESGTYDESVSISSDDFALKGPNAGTPVEQWGPESGQAIVNGQIDVSAAGATINGMTVSPDTNVFNSKPAAAVYCTASDSNIKYNRVADFTVDIRDISPNSIQGIQIYEESGESDRVENVKVKNNMLDNINYQGDSNGGGGYGSDYGNLYGIHIQGGIGDTGDDNGVRVQGNTIKNLSSAGYILGTAVSETGSGPATPKNVTVANNEFAYFDSEQSIPGVAFNVGTEAGEAELNENSIRTPRGVEHKGTGTLDATDNYWGDPSGPSGGYEDPDGVAADGAGARIDITQSGEVDFSPFKTSDT